MNMDFSISVFRTIYKNRTTYVFLWLLICLIACATYFSSTKENTLKPINQTPQPRHVLCLLAPYRERFDELLEFVPHMSKFLNRKSITYRIIVINHLLDGNRFNKGSSYNAGFHIMKKKFPECDYIALHDVDMLPLTNEVSYAYPGNAAYHAIPIGFHPVRVYSSPSYIGGILLLSNENFLRVNGFSNNFWGWGFEDLNFLRRLEKYSVPLTRPEKFFTNRENSFKHIHGKLKVRDVQYCFDPVSVPLSRDPTDYYTGLSDVNYTISSENHLILDGFPFSLFNINIQCNFDITPSCKPFCRDNVTVPKNIWELEDDDISKDQILKANIAWNVDSDSWNRIVNHV